MREIKFRAWDKKDKIMRGVAMLETNNKYPEYQTIYLNGPTSDNVGYRNLPEVELMQYTGLKDKNGVEIYEDDIVKAWSQGVSAIGQVVRRMDGLWIIYPAYQKQTMWGLMPDPDGMTTVEVVGNIHDNPELLEVG